MTNLEFMERSQKINTSQCKEKLAKIMHHRSLFKEVIEIFVAKADPLVTILLYRFKELLLPVGIQPLRPANHR